MVGKLRLDTLRVTMADLTDRGRYSGWAHTSAFTTRDRGHDVGMRLRDHNKGDLALQD